VLLIEWGDSKAFHATEAHRKQRHPIRRAVIPVMRAGHDDLGARVPAVQILRGKTIAVFGLGAIGAPVAIELARNGCSTLHLIEHDTVEPGNSIRWPVGASAWGRRKLDVIEELITRDFPSTQVKPHSQAIGSLNPTPDADLIASVTRDCDLVIDATAAWGVTQLLDAVCKENDVPLIQLFGTPTLGGGVVARFVQDGPCLVCLEYAWDPEFSQPPLERPPGALDESTMAQPPGCAERTFVGASYDLGEISLEAVRLAIDTLGDPNPTPVVHTLRLVGGDGRRIPPSWTAQALERHARCPCATSRTSD
jgi:molybdopterin/thiamine biosynthesis adenylyltransferase